MELSLLATSFGGRSRRTDSLKSRNWVSAARASEPIEFDEVDAPLSGFDFRDPTMRHV
jgi:hypothetical protein